KLDDLLPPVVRTDRDRGAAERVHKELLLRGHVRRVQMVVPVHNRTFVRNENLRAGDSRHEQQNDKSDPAEYKVHKHLFRRKSNRKSAQLTRTVPQIGGGSWCETARFPSVFKEGAKREPDRAKPQ